MVHSSLAHSSLVKKKGGATRKLASFSFSAQPLYRHFPFSPSHIPFSNVYFFFFFSYTNYEHIWSFFVFTKGIWKEMLLQNQRFKMTMSWDLLMLLYLVKLATVTLEATRLFQHCNLTSRASSLSKHPHLHHNYEQWIQMNKDTVMFFSIDYLLLWIFITTSSSYQHLYSLQTSVNWIEQRLMQLACWKQIPASHWTWPVLYQRKILRLKRSNLSNNNNIAPYFLVVEAVTASLITDDWTSLSKKPMLLQPMHLSKPHYTRYR